MNNELAPILNRNTKISRYYIIYFKAFKQTFLITDSCNNPYDNKFHMQKNSLISELIIMRYQITCQIEYL